MKICMMVMSPGYLAADVIYTGIVELFALYW